MVKKSTAEVGVNLKTEKKTAPRMLIKRDFCYGSGDNGTDSLKTEQSR